LFAQLAAQPDPVPFHVADAFRQRDRVAGIQRVKKNAKRACEAQPVQAGSPSTDSLIDRHERDTLVSAISAPVSITIVRSGIQDVLIQFVRRQVQGGNPKGMQRQEESDPIHSGYAGGNPRRNALHLKEFGGHGQASFPGELLGRLLKSVGEGFRDID